MDILLWKVLCKLMHPMMRLEELSLRQSKVFLQFLFVNGYVKITVISI